VNGRISDELGMMWPNLVTYLRELKKTTKTSVMAVHVPAEIRTEHIPHTSLERNSYTNLLGSAASLNKQTETIIPKLAVITMFRHVDMFHAVESFSFKNFCEFQLNAKLTVRYYQPVQGRVNGHDDVLPPPSAGFTR
jgi:hypothetical protein